MRNQMQRLLRNLGVHLDVLDLLRLNLSSKEPHSLKALEAAHSVLCDFMYKNTANQAVLFKELSYFVNQASKDALAVQTATAIFSDNPELCARVSKNVVDSISNAIDSCGRKLSFIRFFRILLNGPSASAKLVQNLVMDCLQAASDKVLLLFADEFLFKHQLVPLLQNSTTMRTAFEVSFCFL
jgi:hypothetical protein